MTVVLHLSDTHFGTEIPATVRAITDFAHWLSPDLLILSGDITQRARRQQFAMARAFVQRLDIPASVIVPGNHDIPLFNVLGRLVAPYAGYRRAFGNDLSPSWSSRDMLVVGVNTTRPSRHKDGVVSDRQIRAVAGRLRQAHDDQLRLVVTHQPIHTVTARDETNRLHGHDRAARAWADAGADLILGGHIHLPYVRPLREHQPELSRAVWAVQAGTAVSARVRGNVPNSVNTIRYDRAADPTACEIERWDCLPGADGFSRVDRHRLTLDRESPAANGRRNSDRGPTTHSDAVDGSR